MAELVDALDSKSSSGNRVGVRFPPSVLSKRFFTGRASLFLFKRHAAVAELVDAHVSGACVREDVGVRLPPAALFWIMIYRIIPQRNTEKSPRYTKETKTKSILVLSCQGKLSYEIISGFHSKAWQNVILLVKLCETLRVAP